MRFLRSESGAVTIPTVLWIPLFVMILVAAVELMLIEMRQVLLNRAVDITTRSLRLGSESLPSHETLKQQICTAIHFVPDCSENLAVEVFPINTDTWSLSNTNAPLCTDGTSSAVLDPEIETGGSNQLIALRACLKLTPMGSGDPLAMALQLDAGGRFALVAMTVFVNEPRS
ncbi:TadE/TadG family type IV pilus assembly protein [Paenirhodobacter sp.]|uniref:TadE/TadG family type IV pilus assembly protein n=1 Tax=Paenirhodobacter sp. TaxID=1965326 RepID=UPI003B50C334